MSEFLCPKKNKIGLGLCWLRNMIKQMFFNTQITSSICSFKCLVLLCNYSGKGIFGNKSENVVHWFVLFLSTKSGKVKTTQNPKLTSTQ